MASNDPLDRIHMHDASGEILGGAEMISLLKAMEKDMTFSDDTVIMGDTAKLVIPRGMTIRQAIISLFSHWYNQQQPTTFERTYRYRPHDGAYAAYRQLRETFGFVDGKPTETIFGAKPPKMVTVHTGPNDSVQVPWGELRVSALADAVITFGTNEDEQFGTVFRMTVTAPRGLEHTIEMLFASIEMELKENSIYRGKVVKAGGSTEPTFVELSDIDPRLVVYAAEVERVLEANLWLPMRRTEEFRRRGLPLKQGVLAYGNFGTGKSLAGLLTARIAAENGWTAILAKSGDDLDELLELAAMYGPAFVFCEDIDTVASADADDIDELLEAFDGVETKGKEILLLATTNNVEALHAGMMRPGRFDVVIEVGSLDGDGIERLIREHVGGSSLEDYPDFVAITREMDGFTPAFVAQAISRAQKYALLDGADRLGTQHFVNAARELSGHLKLMRDAGTKPQKPTLDQAFGDQITNTVRNLAVLLPDGSRAHLVPSEENGS